MMIPISLIYLLVGFGPANEFHDFAALGVGWIFSNEEIVKNNNSFLSFGKLRASYGTTGNDQIGDYQYSSLFTPNSSGGSAYQGINGLAPTGLANPYLQWELTKKFDAGIDLGFLKDRILINMSFYQNESSNQLLPYSLPSITGFTSVLRNLPATVQNTGWEFSLSTTEISTGTFKWTTKFNLTIPRNKLTAFPELSSSAYASRLVLGQPLNIVKVYHLLGVDPATGEYVFEGKNGPTSNPEYGVDNNDIVSLDPKFYGGFENNFSYKGFGLDFLFQFTKQLGPDLNYGNILPGLFYLNEPTTVLNNWKQPGDIATVERYTTNFNLFTETTDALRNSNAGFSDASYIRLKNLSFFWELPMTWIKPLNLKSCKFFIDGQNLLTITGYNGLDPETRGINSLPPLRMISIGINAQL